MHSSWQMQALMCGCPMSVAIPSAGIFHTVFAYCQRLTCCLPVELCFEVYKHAFWCPYSIEGIVYFLFTSWLSFWSQAQLPKTSHLCCLFFSPGRSKTCIVASENIYCGHHQTFSFGPFPGMKWQLMICRHLLTTSCTAQGPPAWAM